MEVEVYHAEKTLQLFDVLREWTIFDFGGVIGSWGRSRRQNPVSKNFKEGVAKTHFSKLMARPLAAKAVKKASRWQRYVCLSGEPTRGSSMYANTPSRPSLV